MGIPDEFEDPFEVPTKSDGDHCGNVAEEEETVGEAAEGELEETVVRSFVLKDGDKPLGLPYWWGFRAV